MEFKILFNINNLLFTDNRPCQTPDFILSNDYSFREKFYTKDFITELGKAETRVRKESVFAYSIISNNAPMGRIDLLNELRREMFEKMQYLDGFLIWLWFSKDSCVYVDKVSGQIDEIENGVIGIHSNSNAWNSSGEKEDTCFSENEIRAAIKIADKYREVCTQNLVSIDDILQNERTNTPLIMGHSEGYNHNNNNAIQRSFIFLAGGRKIKYLPYRIAMYMPIFECLFAIEASEVTQKISERVAFYLSDDKEERKREYETMKIGYDYRSRFLHGDTFKKKHINIENSKPISIKIDDFARRSLTKIILEDASKFLETNSEKRNDFLNDIIFR